MLRNDGINHMLLYCCTSTTQNVVKLVEDHLNVRQFMLYHKQNKYIRERPFNTVSGKLRQGGNFFRPRSGIGKFFQISIFLLFFITLTICKLYALIWVYIIFACTLPGGIGFFSHKHEGVMYFMHQWPIFQNPTHPSQY